MCERRTPAGGGPRTFARARVWRYSSSQGMGLTYSILTLERVNHKPWPLRLRDRGNQESSHCSSHLVLQETRKYSHNGAHGHSNERTVETY